MKALADDKSVVAQTFRFVSERFTSLPDDKMLDWSKLK